MQDSNPRLRTPLGGEQPLPGLVWSLEFHDKGAFEELNAERPITARDDGWLWLHFSLTHAGAGACLRSSLDIIPAPARDLLVTADEHQQLHAEDTCIFGIVADLKCDLDGITDEIGFLHFAMTPTLLVTARRTMLNGVETVHRALKSGLRVESPAMLLEAILERIVDSIDLYSERLASQLDRIEDELVKDDRGDDWQTLGRVRRMTVRLHRQLVVMRALMHKFERDIEPRRKPRVRLAAGKLGQRLDWLDTEILALRDRAHLLQEENMLKNAEQTNRNLQILSVLSIVFLPASLVAGIFGMNVKGLPLTEDDSGFLWAIVILTGASALVVWLLKRTGVLRR